MGRYVMRARDARPVSPRAFTLVEVLVALAIVATALVALLRLQVVSINMTRHATRMGRATLLAHAKMAEARSPEGCAIGSQSGEESTDDGGVLGWQTDVTQAQLAVLENVNATELRDVRVRVTWRDGAHTREVALVSYVCPDE